MAQACLKKGKPMPGILYSVHFQPDPCKFQPFFLFQPTDAFSCVAGYVPAPCALKLFFQKKAFLSVPENISQTVCIPSPRRMPDKRLGYLPL